MLLASEAGRPPLHQSVISYTPRKKNSYRIEMKCVCVICAVNFCIACISLLNLSFSHFYFILLILLFTIDGLHVAQNDEAKWHSAVPLCKQVMFCYVCLEN